MSWTSFFKNPKTALVGSGLAIFGGATASVLTSTDPVSNTLIIAAALSALGGLGGNFFSSACEKQFLNKTSRDEILKNGDLTRAVGRAIFLLILKESEKESYGDDCERLKTIGNSDETLWEDIVLGVEDKENPRFELSEEDLRQLSGDFLTQYVASETGKIDEIESLTPQEWRIIVEKLGEKHGLIIQFDTSWNVAQALHKGFAKSLRKTLITDFAEDGKAYASLQLRILGEILFYVKENHKSNQEILAKAKLLDERTAQILGLLEIPKFNADETFWQKAFDLQTDILDNTKELLTRTGKLEGLLYQILEIISNQTQPPKSEFKGFHKSFPFPPKYFTGRVGVLEQLEKTLATENQASFYGTHGLGKTRTAIEFALRHQEKFDFVLFISATKGNFVNNAAVVGGEISKDIEDAMTLEAKFGLFLEYLQNRADWLIIVDNVEDILEVRGKIPHFFNGKVIYTSNLPDIYNVATSIPIEAMTQTEAELTLFRRKYEYKKLELSETSIEEQTAITAIVDKIGTLPIGLNLAGAFVHKYQRTFQEYLTDYEAFEDATFQYFDLADYYEAEYLKGLTEKEKAEYKGIAGVFLLTYQRITTPKDDSEQEKLITETIKAIMNLSVFLAPERVPEEIWKKGLKRIDETLAEASENAMFWLEVGKRLTQSAFFVRNEDEKTSTTHRLILTILQKQLKKEEKQKFAEIAVDVINNLWVSSEFENWKICNRLLRHAETALNYAENLEIETNNAARLCNKIAYYIEDLADYEKAIIYYQKALRIGEKTIGKEHPDYAIHLNNLASVYYLQGRYDEAIEKYEEALRIDEKTIGKEHPEYAKHLSNLANVYYLQGRYDEAIEKYEEALQIDEKTIGKEHPDYAIDLGNLAKIYIVQGNFQLAEKNNEHALEIFEKTVGKFHPYYATCLNDLALIYDSQGRYDEAIEKFEEVLRIDEKTIGKEHPDYAIHLNNLANVYRSQGRYDDALPFYQDALLIFEKTLPENHPYIQGTRESLENCRKAAEKERGKEEK